MTRKKLAFVVGAISATLNVMLATFVGMADPGHTDTTQILIVASPINAGLAALAAYLTGSDAP